MHGGVGRLVQIFKGNQFKRIVNPKYHILGCVFLIIKRVPGFFLSKHVARVNVKGKIVSLNGDVLLTTDSSIVERGGQKKSCRSIVFVLYISFYENASIFKPFSSQQIFAFVFFYEGKYPRREQNSSRTLIRQTN